MRRRMAVTSGRPERERVARTPVTRRIAITPITARLATALTSRDAAITRRVYGRLLRPKRRRERGLRSASFAPPGNGGPAMAWDFETEPEFEEKLAWMR